MVKIANLVALASSTSAAVVTRAPQQSSSVKMSQVPQELAMEQGKCGKVYTGISIYNNCNYPVHIWRDDSSVDKAAVLQPQAALLEPMRHDWRSGYIGYRLSPSARGPYDGQAGTTTLTYIHSVSKDSVAVVAQVGQVFNRAFKDEDISLAASAWALCNQDFNSLTYDKLIGVGVSCEGKIEKGGLVLGVGLCMEPGTYKL